MLPLVLCSCSPSPNRISPSEAKAQSEDPDHNVWTGEDLKALLLPVNVLPKKYKPNKDLTADSGTHFGPTGQKPISTDCTLLQRTSWVDAAGTGLASWAQADFRSSSQEEYSEEIDSFRGTDAWTAMTRLKKYAESCTAFKDSYDGTTATYKAITKTVPGLGDESFETVMTTAVYDGGMTTVVSRVGHDIVFSSYDVRSSDLGAPAVGFARKLVANVKAKTGN
ncbi:hypothetical protein N8I84_32880 [Streptomyces cynarae]|uniref:Sensor domain-containing protein n=1 Tax=Streptomyces cynarae TaxID=2981134 RepID=A0ABY6EG62_9ACTN|nr:hypothetical protein [Streptomyces cynarae]UXY22963.1 hypothetical protein N8I84_32880 [Streptomyces cynarae]